MWRLHQTAPRRGMSWRTFFLAAALLVFVAVGGSVYVREITSTAASGYDVSALERRLDTLREEEGRLELETAEFQSLRRIEERLLKLNLVPVDRLLFSTPLLAGLVTTHIPVGTARQ